MANKQSHCKRGHPLSGDNLKMRRNGSRMCRICYLYRRKMSRNTPSGKLRTRRDNRLRVYRKYSMTEEQWFTLLETQNNCCALCGLPFEDKPGLRPHTDHNHKTGIVRGLLHGHCNTAIGLLSDDATKCRCAAEYLERQVI